MYITRKIFLWAPTPVEDWFLQIRNQLWYILESESELEIVMWNKSWAMKEFSNSIAKDAKGIVIDRYS